MYRCATLNADNNVLQGSVATYVVAGIWSDHSIEHVLLIVPVKIENRLIFDGFMTITWWLALLYAPYPCRYKATVLRVKARKYRSVVSRGRRNRVSLDSLEVFEV